MKLIITGATGFLATEVIRQAISNPRITSIIALARRETPAPSKPAHGGKNFDAQKLRSVVCEDFGNYSEVVKNELKGAEACIWCMAVTPSKSKSLPFDEVTRINHDYTITGLTTMAPLAARPFRFLYTSGVNAERDQTKKPWVLGEYALLRGRTESAVLSFTEKSDGAVQACVAKPGIITSAERGNGLQGISLGLVRLVFGLPKVDVSEIAATLIQQALDGFEKDTLLNADLVRIGEGVLRGEREGGRG